MGPDAPDGTDAASVSRTSLAPNDAGALSGVLSSPPVKVTMSEEDDGAAAGSSACAFSSASLFLFLRRRSLAAFLALFRAFSILFCLLPEGRSASADGEVAQADDETAVPAPAVERTGRSPGKASDGASVDSFFPLLLFCPPAASGFFFSREEVPVSCAVAGDERTRAEDGMEVEPEVPVDAV